MSVDDDFGDFATIDVHQPRQNELEDFLGEFAASPNTPTIAFAPARDTFGSKYIRAHSLIKPLPRFSLHRPVSSCIRRLAVSSFSSEAFTSHIPFSDACDPACVMVRCTGIVAPFCNGSFRCNSGLSVRCGRWQRRWSCGGDENRFLCVDIGSTLLFYWSLQWHFYFWGYFHSCLSVRTHCLNGDHTTETLISQRRVTLISYNHRMMTFMMTCRNFPTVVCHCVVRSRDQISLISWLIVELD